MTYKPIPVPQGTPPLLATIVRENIDPLLSAVHAMFRLPIKDDPGLRADCSFAIVQILLDIVGGASATIYRYPDKFGSRGEEGRLFKEVLERHYPWQQEPDQPETIRDHHAATVLYETFRSPLVHRLGVSEKTIHGQPKLAKGALPETEIEQIENSVSRPTEWITTPTLSTDSQNKADRTKTVVISKMLYWGIRQMIVNILEEQAERKTHPEPTDVELLTVRTTSTSAW